MNIFKRQKGLSLVELMVALVISLFLLSGIIGVYLTNKTSYRFTGAISRIQENARFAMDTMAQDLRMAGFFGCAIFDPNDQTSLDSLVNNLDPAGAGYDADLMDFIGRPLVEGTENDGLNGSDSISLRGAKPGNASVEEPFAVSKSANIFITQPNNIQADDIVMISNCKGADIFQVTNANDGSGGNAAKTSVVHNTGTGSPGNYNPDTCNSGHCLSQAYGADAIILELQAVTYSIAAGAGGEPALFRATYDTIGGVVANEELVDGIEQMQVLYGVDTTDDGHPNQYMVATAVVDWYSVMAVRLMLLMRSENSNVVEAAQVVSFNGATTTAGDMRLRQVFTTTITLRNRVSDI